MRNNERSVEKSGFQRFLEKTRRNLFPTAEEKEQDIIHTLPPVCIRLYGDIDYNEQLRYIPEKFKEKVIILTTSDTSSQKIQELAANNWKVVQADNVNDEDAKNNSSLLLNKAVEYAKGQDIPYLFFLSSGFQGNVDTFYSMYHELAKQYPDEDAYYFILPETHYDAFIDSEHSTKMDDIYDFLLKKFPFETALIVKTDLLDFETTLSRKGEMGTTESGIPLGGMEFFLTLLSIYKKSKDKGELFSPKMLGIVLPVILQKNRNRIITTSDPVAKREIEMLGGPEALEITSGVDKLSRRIPTWKAAMKKLSLTDDDIKELFSHTQFETGVRHVAFFDDPMDFNNL